ncbi:MAG: cfa [Thermoleophilia bacterium]|nr:cfa [Thermoleophilia bacterium]
MSNAAIAVTTAAPASAPPIRDASERLVPIPRARGRIRGALFRRLVPRLVQQVSEGCLDVELSDGTVLRGGTPGGVHGRIRVLDDRCFQQVAARGQRGFGESFVLGMWTSPDPAVALEVMARSAAANGERFPMRWIRLAQRLRPTWQRANGTRSAKRYIAYHYDLGNDFFGAFLDPTMTYSCADWEDSSDTLQHAQLAKFQHICEELDIQPGHRVLEIGCGWGGFAEYVARERGAQVTAVTVSEQQHAYAVTRMQAAGVDELVDVRLQDYRLVEGEFDRIVSIEMLEAVGAREYGRFFRTVDRLLAPAGRAFIQVIGFQDRDYARQLRSKGWIRMYVFPGGMLPTVTVLSRTMTRVSSLQVHGLREIGQHYGPTLRTWRERLLEQGEELDRVGYGHSLRRSWEYYLAFCEAGFRSGHIRTMQLHITRAGTVSGS